MIINTICVNTKTCLLLKYKKKQGRKIYRHESGEGSVIEFDMYGTPVKLFVADAKYRAIKEWRLNHVDTPLDNFQEDYRWINPGNVPDDESKPLSYSLTDQELQAQFPSFKSDKTARQNTDVLMQCNNDMDDDLDNDNEAVHWCRAQNIPGIGNLDLPNIYELMIIYLEADNIDTLDPTSGQYPDMMLGYKSTYGRFRRLRPWSSTEGYIVDGKSYGARSITEEGYVGDGIRLPGIGMSGVLPVKEL